MSQNAQPILQVKKVTKTFGSLVALEDITFDVYPGEIVSIIGPNGAGKTTLFNVIAGILSPTDGSIMFGEQETAKMLTYKVARMGIASTFQQFRLFHNMSGFENAMVGTWKLSKVGWLMSMLGLPQVKSEDNTIAKGIMKDLALLGILDARIVPPPSTMTLRDQRALTIGRAIVSHPKLVLLDEPAAALNYEEIMELSQQFLRYKQQGMSILLIDHRMEIVMGISDRVIVLNFGSKIADDTPANIQANKEVLSVYLGEEID